MVSDRRPQWKRPCPAALREELDRLDGRGVGRLGEAAEILGALVLADDFPEFLTLPAYERLED